MKPKLLIKSVTQLQNLIAQPVLCEFVLDGQPVSVPCQRMTATTAELVRALRREATPPYRKDRNDYDHYAKEYQDKATQNERIARSLIIYSHCPLVSGLKAGLTNRDEIHAHVNALFTENILELLSLTIQAGGLERVEDKANFTLPPASES